MNTDSNEKTAIITGVTGQMGSYFSEFLLKKGIKVIGAVRRLSVPNKENIKHIQNPNFILELMDLGDAHSISNIINKYKPDYFINCAANSFVGSSWDCPEQHFEFNTLGVLRQLEAIRRFSPQTKYANFGSSEEFGDVRYSPQDEKHPPCSRSPYGASKVAARQIVKVYRESFDLFAIQCWCFNYESERRGEEFVTRKISKGVARIYHSLKAGSLDFEPIRLGNLLSKRDWSHAEDFVRGVWAMLNQEKTNEYVLSSGETHSIKEFVERAFSAAKIMGCWLQENDPEKMIYAMPVLDDVEYAPLVVVDPKFFRPAEVQLLLGDSSEARKNLGWKPEISFGQLVDKMVKHDIEIY